jgi:cytochrome c-type biogenesis protein
LIPSYLSFLSGVSSSRFREGKVGAKDRWATFLHGLMFVIGFSIIFVALGASAQALRQVLVEHKHAVAKIGGALIILLGIHLTGLFKLGFLERERRFQLAEKPLGYLGSVLVGIIFAFGWTPCLGPVLAAVLTMAVSAPQASALVMMGVYALGLAVPFLVVAAGMSTFFNYFGALRRHTRTISVVSGLILIAAGVAMVAGWFDRLSGVLN